MSSSASSFGNGKHYIDHCLESKVATSTKRYRMIWLRGLDISFTFMSGLLVCSAFTSKRISFWFIFITMWISPNIRFDFMSNFWIRFFFRNWQEVIFSAHELVANGPLRLSAKIKPYFQVFLPVFFFHQRFHSLTAVLQSIRVTCLASSFFLSPPLWEINNDDLWL